MDLIAPALASIPKVAWGDHAVWGLGIAALPPTPNNWTRNSHMIVVHRGLMRCAREALMRAGFLTFQWSVADEVENPSIPQDIKLGHARLDSHCETFVFPRNMRNVAGRKVVLIPHTYAGIKMDVTGHVPGNEGNALVYLDAHTLYDSFEFVREGEIKYLNNMETKGRAFVDTVDAWLPYVWGKYTRDMEAAGKAEMWTAREMEIRGSQSPSGKDKGRFKISPKPSELLSKLKDLTIGQVRRRTL